MCYLDLGPCDVWQETQRKARKEHRCGCCRRTIRAGETYLVHFSIYEGNLNSQKCCTDCKSDRQDFANAHGGMICTPEILPMLLEECIDEEPAEAERWRPMLERILRPEATAG